jgi:ribosomal protein S18 acetylase RimI-like enzyme
MAPDRIEGMALRALRAEDYDEAIVLWKRCPGIGLSAADERGPLTAFLAKNQGLCFAAWIGGTLVGTSLCGSDGRRGYLYHVAVDPERRRFGIGSALVSASLGALAATGVNKCHLFVFADNVGGADFWSATGWTRRNDIAVYSKNP